MPDLSGIDVTRRLSTDFPGIYVLLLTLHEDTSLLREAIKAGAAGFILKKAVEDELIEAIRQVAEGKMYIHPAMTRALINEEPPALRNKGITLTQREIDVLRLLARGLTNRQIADELALSTRTVETHRANLMAKLDLHSRVELMRYAAEHRLA
jgi:two-component system, NarL family, response regulator NreC